ncbi:hypothetical protein BOTU111921_13280 [Bordetella tumbae]
MRFAALLSLTLLAACASKPPTPVVIPSESQVDQGSATPAELPRK